MKIKAIIALFALGMLTSGAYAATETVFEGLVWAGTTAPPEGQRPKQLQGYTPEIQIMSYESEGNTYHVPVGYSDGYRGNLDFFSAIFGTIESRAGDILSTAPNATQAEKFLHLVIVTPGTGATLSADQANGLLAGSKIIGDPFDIVDAAGTALKSNCYLIAVKKSGISSDALNEAISQMFTAAVGPLL